LQPNLEEHFLQKKPCTLLIMMVERGLKTLHFAAKGFRVLDETVSVRRR